MTDYNKITLDQFLTISNNAGYPIHAIHHLLGEYLNRRIDLPEDKLNLIKGIIA